MHLPTSTTGQQQRDLFFLILIACSGLVWPWWSHTVFAALVIGWLAVAIAFFAPPLGLVLLAVIAPFEQPRELYFLGTVYTTEWLLLLLIPGWIWHLVKQPAWRRPVAPIWRWLIPFLIILLIPLLFQPSLVLLKGIVRWLEFLSILIIGSFILRQPKSAIWCLWALSLAAVAQAIWGVSQTWQGPTQWPALLSYATPWGEMTRAAAGYGPNTLAGLIVLVAPFVLVHGLSHSNQWVRRIGWLLFTILMTGLIATFSLIGWLSTAVAGLVLLLFIKSHTKPIMLVALLIIIAILTTSMLLFPNWQHASFLATKLLSLQDRLQYAQVVGTMLPIAPWLGIGAGLYKVQAIYWQQLNINIIGLLTHPHSLWLLILVENGVLGLAAFTWWLIKLTHFFLSQASRLINRQQLSTIARIRPLAMIAGLAGVLVLNIGEHGLVHDRGIHVAIALLAGMVLVTKTKSRPFDRAQHLFNRIWRKKNEQTNWSKEYQEREQGRQALIHIIEKWVQKINRPIILELGCGPALDAIRLSKKIQGDVHALDYSTAALTLAEQANKQLAGRVIFHKGDVRATRLEAEYFDIIYSQGLLEHFKEVKPVWQEMKRLLKPDGLLVIDVPQWLNSYSLTKCWHQLAGTWPWGWERSFTLKSLKKAGQKEGFELIHHQGYGYHRGKIDGLYNLKKWSSRSLPRLWDQLERQWGSYWMMNIIVVFKKKRA